MGKLDMPQNGVNKQEQLDMLVDELNKKIDTISDKREIDGKMYTFISPDDKALFPDELFELAEEFVKKPCQAREATQVEEINVTQDGIRYVALPGDMIMKNSSDQSEYIFGSPVYEGLSKEEIETKLKDPEIKKELEEKIKAKKAKFDKTYKPSEEEGIYISVKLPFKAIVIKSPIVFEKWGGAQKLDEGGVMTQQPDGERYGIDKESFESDYEKIQKK